MHHAWTGGSDAGDGRVAVTGAVGLGTEELIVSVGTAVCIVTVAAPNTCLAGTTNAANVRIEHHMGRTRNGYP